MVLAAQNRPANCADLAAKAIDGAGISNILISIPQGRGVTPDGVAAASVPKAFVPDKIRDILTGDFLKSCDTKMLTSVLAGMSTPLGMRIRKMEIAAEGSDNQQLVSYQQSVEKEPPPETRNELIGRMDASLRISKFATDLWWSYMDSGTAAFGGLSSVTDNLAAMKVRLTESITGMIRVRMLYAYREASDQDLIDYLSMYETPPFVQFEAASRQACLAAASQQGPEPAIDLKGLALPVLPPHR